jgi:uncharacterized protein (DUF2267 family)
MDELTFIHEVARQLDCDYRRAEDVVLAVFRELRDRLSAKEAGDVAAQLPSALKRLWRQEERADAPVERTHVADVVGRVRWAAGFGDDAEAERAVRAVFGELQKLLGSPTGLEGEAWDVFSQLPKDLKRFWIASAS